MQTLELEHVACDLCGSPDYSVRYRKPDDYLWINLFEYPVVECKACGLVYVNPRPTRQSMARFYPDSYFSIRSDSEYMERYAIQAEFLPRLEQEKVLDIGCARGDFLHYLKSKYPRIRAYGIDPYCDYGVDNDIHLVNSSLIDANFETSTFDLITAWAVFEHLHEPKEYFREVARILRKEGRFFFLVTNSESLYGTRAYKEDIPRHLYHFSPETLEKYADECGFRVNDIIFDDSIWDGRGIGTFYFLLSKLTGMNWQKLYHNDLNILQTLSSKVGRLLDKIVFASHWEKALHKSGIMIVEFRGKTLGD